MTERIGPKSPRRPFHQIGRKWSRPVFTDAVGDRWLALGRDSKQKPDAIYLIADRGIRNVPLRRLP